jgi:hypothetical protein
MGRVNSKRVNHFTMSALTHFYVSDGNIISSDATYWSHSSKGVTQIGHSL